MKNYPVDVQIYVSKMMDFFETVVPSLCEEEGIEDKDKFTKLVQDRVLVTATENLIDFEEPILEEEQMTTILNECIVEYHLDLMIANGLIKANIDIETGENVYSLTDEAKSRLQ